MAPTRWVAGPGPDTLAGGAGKDSLTGGQGADFFFFDTAFDEKKNLDKVIDFEHGTDQIVLDQNVFGNVVPGSTWPGDTLVYDTQTGALSYDADGIGPGPAIAFGTMIGVPTLDWADFSVQ